MGITAYLGYEYHLNLYSIIVHGSEEEQTAACEAQRKYISEYTKPDDLEMRDISIPGGTASP